MITSDLFKTYIFSVDILSAVVYIKKNSEMLHLTYLYTFLLKAKCKFQMNLGYNFSLDTL